jgi:hypothetical protein
MSAPGLFFSPEIPASITTAWNIIRNLCSILYRSSKGYGFRCQT